MGTVHCHGNNAELEREQGTLFLTTLIARLSETARRAVAVTLAFY